MKYKEIKISASIKQETIFSEFLKSLVNSGKGSQKPQAGKHGGE